MTATVAEIIREGAPLLSAGLISADIMNLGREIEILSQSGIRILHFDVMDNHFAPQLTWGPALIKGIKTNLYKDVHLMVSEPLSMIDACAEAGADMITVHAESSVHIHQALKMIGDHNSRHGSRIIRGIALNPGTSLSVLKPLLDQLDMILLLAVNPGFAAQSFIDGTLKRVEKVKRMAAENGKEIITAVDGGINRSTIKEVAALKPDLIIAGSALFEGGKLQENISFFTSACESPSS